MIGSSSTWYAMSARLSTSRSSAARAAALVVLEEGKELLGAVDDRVGLFGLEARAVVDPAPRHRDGEHARGLGSPDVEGRVADVRGCVRIRTESLGAEEERLWIGLVPFRLVPADDRLEEVAERDIGEGELDGRAPLRRHDAESAPLFVQADEHVLHPGAGLELVVERLVVGA